MSATTLAPTPFTSFFWSGDALRSRSVGTALRHAVLDAPAPPPRVTADWERDIRSHLMLEPGDVEQLPLARTRFRWPAIDEGVRAMESWTRTLGLGDVLASCDIALMACRGARYHHDGEQYGGSAFCNLFLSVDKGLDVDFPGAGVRLALQPGVAMVFDTCQPHAVIARHASGFHASDFPADADLTQVFLTWELPIEDARVAQVLGITFDTDAATALQLDEEQVWAGGARAAVEPESGSWRRAQD